VRIHRTRHLATFFGRSIDGRFDAPLGEHGVLYAAEDVYTAFVETFGQSTGVNTVTTTALAERSLSRVEVIRPLRLVDLTGPGLARIGADERLCSGEHEVAQRWAAAIWRHPSQPDGLLYRARHDPSRRCLALYDRAETAVRVTLLGGMLDPALSGTLGDILDTYAFGLA
jgi:RES domain